VETNFPINFGREKPIFHLTLRVICLSSVILYYKHATLHVNYLNDLLPSFNRATAIPFMPVPVPINEGHWMSEAVSRWRYCPFSVSQALPEICARMQPNFHKQPTKLPHARRFNPTRAQVYADTHAVSLDFVK
jgi:hypothetical protein